MQRFATALVVGTLAACAGDAGTDPTSNSPNAALTPTAMASMTAPATPSTAVAPNGQSALAGAAAPSGSAPGTSASAALPPAAGTPGAQAASAPAMPAAATPPPNPNAPSTAGPASPTAQPGAADQKPALAMDECGLDTEYAGDEYCILPPPADQGFQVHIGPTNYDNPGPEYILQPGEENVVDMSTTSGNDKQVYYYYRQYRMRPGSHHVIFTANGRRVGGTQNLAKDNPDLGQIPEENKDIGLPLDAHANINVNMHYYNFTDKPIIRELWANFWYKDPAEVKEATREVFSPTGVTAAVAHSHVVVGASCPVTAEGRLLTLYGHRHLNNVRFSVFRNRGSDRQLVLEDYESEHPAVFEFNSLAKNEPPDPATKRPGAISGILDVKPGDTIDFECEIINTTDKNFTGANEAADDEMCILVGDAIGGGLQPFCSPMQAKHVTN